MKHFLTLFFLLSFSFSHAQTSGGPDLFGYHWFNSSHPLGPAYNWIDVNTLPGTVTANGLTDDNIIGPFPMPIPFQFYGTFPSQFWIGSNGYISFSGTPLANPFPTIPSPTQLNNYMAVKTTDLTFVDSNVLPIPSATCKYYVSPGNDSLVISYMNVPFWDITSPGYLGTNSFQVILESTNNSITYQYQSQIGVSGYSTNFISIGIENQLGITGLQMLYDVYPVNGTAVRFSCEDINQVQGIAFADLNSNSVMDGNETPADNVLISEQNSGAFTFSNINGTYFLLLIDSGNYVLSAEIPSTNYFIASPVSHPVYFPSVDSVMTGIDFALQPQMVVNDLGITLTPVTQFRTGVQATYRLRYTNLGTTILSPEVRFFNDPLVSFTAASVTPTQIYPDSVLWNLPPLQPLHSGYIYVYVTVSISAVSGDLVNSTATIGPLTNENTLFNNQSAFELFVTGSFDPNDILASRDTILTTELSNPPWIDYLIRFQNTGNDTAFTVRIQNPVPIQLNVGTMEMVDASHPMTFTYYNLSRTADFLFTNILLPDSNVNEEASHGYIRYRIKPNSSLTAGTLIRDSALIYFDFNSAVATNTALTRIVLPTGLEENHSVSGLSLFPNPAGSEVTINYEMKSGGELFVELLNLQSQVVKPVTSIKAVKGNHEFVLSLNGIASGVYMVRLTNGDDVTYLKLVKQ